MDRATKGPELSSKVNGPRVCEGTAVWFLLHAHLIGSRPSIWRRFRLPAKVRLPKLHKVLQALFQWQDYHLHQFEKAEVVYLDPEMHDDWDLCWSDSRQVALGELLTRVGSSLVYRYDFGDDWTVKLKLEAITDEGCAEVLEGERAGPPEDCGGLPGLQELNRCLANPKHPEYARLREWVGSSYRADQLNVESLSKKLARLFPVPKIRTAQVVKDPCGPLDFVPVGPRLENYDLKKLSLREIMLAALVERGQPMALEELAERIQAAGQALTHGVVSLKKAWRQDSIFYPRRDQRLEPNLDHPEIWRYDLHLRGSWRFQAPANDGPLLLSELERILEPYSHLSQAEWTLALVDSLGRADLREVSHQLEEWGKKFKGDLVMMDGSVVVPTESRRQAVRLKVRQRLAERQRWAHRGELRRQLVPPSHPWHLVCWEGDRARVRELPSGSEFSLEGSAVAEFLAGVRVIFAADVFRLFEEAGVLASTDMHRFDLMPMPNLDGQRQYASGLRLEDFIQATLRACYGANSSLEERLVYHAALLSYGQLHGYVVAPDSPEYPRVYWDIGLEGNLRARFLRALEEDREIWVSHKPRETLRPELYRSPFMVERPGQDQVYGRLSGAPTMLFYRDIYLAHSPPCAPSLEQLAYRLTQPWFLMGPFLPLCAKLTGGPPDPAIEHPSG